MGKGVTMVISRMMDHQHIAHGVLLNSNISTFQFAGPGACNDLYHSKRSVDECCSVPLGLIGLHIRHYSAAFFVDWGFSCNTTNTPQNNHTLFRSFI